MTMDMSQDALTGDILASQQDKVIHHQEHKQTVLTMIQFSTNELPVQ